MRSLGFRTNVLLALAAAVGLVATLGRPWYAAAPPGAEGTHDIQDRAATIADTVQRWMSEPGGTTGWEALHEIAWALAAMAGFAALGALICLLIPGLETLGRDVLRYGAYAALAIVAWKLFDSPGDNAALELRNGALAAAGCALVLVTCASAVAGAKLQQRRETAYLAT